MRYYLCDMVLFEDVDQDYSRPVILEYTGQCVSRGSTATRTLAWSYSITPSQHATAIADARIDYFPFEDEDGNVLDLTAPLSDMTLENIAALIALGEAEGIPSDGITGTTTVGAAVNRAQAWFSIEQRLNGAGLSMHGALDDTLAVDMSSVGPVLAGYGLQTSGMSATMTYRQAWLYLLVQV